MFAALCIRCSQLSHSCTTVITITITTIGNVHAAPASKTLTFIQPIPTTAAANPSCAVVTSIQPPNTRYPTQLRLQRSQHTPPQHNNHNAAAVTPPWNFKLRCSMFDYFRPPSPRSQSLSPRVSHRRVDSARLTTTTPHCRRARLSCCKQGARSDGHIRERGENQTQGIVVEVGRCFEREDAHGEQKSSARLFESRQQ